MKILPGLHPGSQRSLSPVLSALQLRLLEHSTLVLAAFRGEWVESCPTTEDRAAEAGKEEEDGRQQMSGSHPALSRAGEHLSPPDLPQVCFRAFPASNPFSLAPRAQGGFLESRNLEPEEVLQVQLRGFKKDVCFYRVLVLGGLLGH